MGENTYPRLSDALYAARAKAALAELRGGRMGLAEAMDAIGHHDGVDDDGLSELMCLTEECSDLSCRIKAIFPEEADAAVGAEDWCPGHCARYAIAHRWYMENVVPDEWLREWLESCPHSRHTFE